MDITTRVNGHVFVWHELDDVAKFNLKFGLPIGGEPKFLSQEDTSYRVKFLQEELDELAVAVHTRDMAGAADALVDLAYVLYGTVLMMGLGPHWEALWSEVQRANLSKERVADATQSKRGHKLDVIKPVGWVGPDFGPILGPGPWQTEGEES